MLREDPLEGYKRRQAEALAEARAEAERLEAVKAMKGSLSYSKEMAAEICEQIAEGATLKSICALDHTPALRLVRRWLKERPEFAEAFQAAEFDRRLAWEDIAIDTARDASHDRIQKDTDHGYVPVPDSAAVARSKLIVDTIIRRLRAEWPEKYGDAITLKPSSPDFGEQLKTMPLGDIERMAENARQLERDDEIRALLETKEQLRALNKDRRTRGEAPLSLADYMARQDAR